MYSVNTITIHAIVTFNNFVNEIIWLNSQYCIRCEMSCIEIIGAYITIFENQNGVANSAYSNFLHNVGL